MVGNAAPEKKLYDAATIGDVGTLQQVLQQNPHLLDVVSFPCLKNVLHIAIRQGEESLVEEVLSINPELARDVDSKKSSSLHIAAAQGNVEIAKKLLEVAPEMCWWLDDQGMNPIHIAAMKGHVEILRELLQQDLFPALERVHHRQTVLHLCVKHRQFKTLVVLAEKLDDLAGAKDDDGETALHLAVRSNQFPIVRYLVGRNKITELAVNSMGKTALDILDERPLLDTGNCLEIKLILDNFSHESKPISFPKLSEMTMLVVVLIATMAFQATVSPPGGVWQEDGPSHRAGEAVMASAHPNMYKHFVRATDTAFISSLITILLITTQVPLQNLVSLLITICTMWVSLVSIGVSYGASSSMTDPLETQSIGRIVVIVVGSTLIGVTILALVFRHKLQQFIPRSKPLQENQTIDELIALASKPDESLIDDIKRIERQNSFFNRRMWRSPLPRDTELRVMN